MSGSGGRSIEKRFDALSPCCLDGDRYGRTICQGSLSLQGWSLIAGDWMGFLNLDEVSDKRRIEIGRRDTVDSVGGLGSDIRFAVDQ